MMTREFHRDVPAERQTDHERAALRLSFDHIGEGIHGSGKRERLLRQRAMDGQVWGYDEISIRKTVQLSQPDFARGDGTVDEHDSRRIDSSRDVEPRIWKLSHV